MHCASDPIQMHKKSAQAPIYLLIFWMMLAMTHPACIGNMIENTH